MYVYCFNQRALGNVSHWWTGLVKFLNYSITQSLNTVIYIVHLYNNIPVTMIYNNICKTDQEQLHFKTETCKISHKRAVSTQSKKAESFFVFFFTSERVSGGKHCYVHLQLSVTERVSGGKHCYVQLQLSMSQKQP